MYLPHFFPFVDVPLAIALYALSLAGTIVWLRKADAKQDTQHYVSEKSIAGRILIIVLVVFLSCYGIDVAFWFSILGLAILFTAATFFGGEAAGLLAGAPIIMAFAIKEFVLGFPTLILHPGPNSLPNASELIQHELVGKRAVTISDLRPFGSIEYEGRVYQAVSKSNGFVPSNTDVVIMNSKNSVYEVQETVPTIIHANN